MKYTIVNLPNDYKEGDCKNCPFALKKPLHNNLGDPYLNPEVICVFAKEYKNCPIEVRNDGEGLSLVMDLNEVMCRLHNPEDEKVYNPDNVTAYKIAIKILEIWKDVIDSYSVLVDEIKEKDDMLVTQEKMKEWNNKTLRNALCRYYEYKIMLADDAPLC